MESEEVNIYENPAHQNISKHVATFQTFGLVIYIIVKLILNAM